MRALRWDDVRIFLALARARSLAPAAKTLDIDASTASRRLVALEETVGARLFDRSRDGLCPTGAAERLLVAAERMEAAALTFARDAAGFEREIEGRVRVSAPPGIAEVFVAAAVPYLRARHPRIVLDVDARVSVVDLARREADHALRTLRPRGQDLVQKLLARTRATILGSREYVAELGTLKRLADARYVIFGEVLAALPQYGWMKKHLPHPEVAMVSDSYACQLRAAEAGAGLVFAPPAMATLRNLVEPKMGPHVRHALAALPEDDLWLVGHTATREVPRVAAVWAFFEETFADVTTSASVSEKRSRIAR